MVGKRELERRFKEYFFLDSGNFGGDECWYCDRPMVCFKFTATGYDYVPVCAGCLADIAAEMRDWFDRYGMGDT